MHKRGVENVIHFQSKASPFAQNYYIHWDNKNQVYRYENLICIGIKKNFYWFLTLNFILIKIKKKLNKLFIHSHNPLMSIMCLYKSNIFTVHDALYYITSAVKHKLRYVFWLLEKILYLRCGFVHFISDYTKQKSLFIGNNDFVIIPNTSHYETVNLNKLTVDPYLRKFSKGVIKVFIVRSIEERALINLVINLANILQANNFEFLIAGKGPLLDFYRNKVTESGLDNIILLGYVKDDDLIKFYQNCDIVIVPALYGEGFGLPIIEGYLFDKPVIASDVCAIPEVIISKDFLFENSVESMLSKLNYALYQNNFDYNNYYDKNFSNKIVISKMKELYKELV